MRQVQWALGPVGGDTNVRAGKWVQARLPAEGRMVPPLELMSPTLELAPSPLENAPLENVQLPSACAPLEVVLSGVCKLCAFFCSFQFCGWHCECGFYGGWDAAALCSIKNGRTTAEIDHVVL